MEKNNNTLMWIGIAVLALLVIGSFGFGFGRYPGYGMMGMMYGNYGAGMMFFGWILGIAFLVALGLFIAWLVKQLQK